MGINTARFFKRIESYSYICGIRCESKQFSIVIELAHTKVRIPIDCTLPAKEIYLTQILSIAPDRSFVFITSDDRKMSLVRAFFDGNTVKTTVLIAGWQMILTPYMVTERL